MERRLPFHRRGGNAVAADRFGGDGRAAGDPDGGGACLFHPLGAFPVWLYTYVFRGTPLYVQLLVFYSGMYSLEVVRGSEFLNAFFRSGLNCTILALTLNTCAYTTEIFAGAIRSVPHGEIEAANAYGFSRFKMYRCIICLRRCAPRCRPTATK